MKQKLMLLPARYLTALRTHLKQEPPVSWRSALRLGRQAVTLGVDTLELARIHEQTISTLGLSKSDNGLTKRAENFFVEALSPIVGTHQAARQSKIDLHQLTLALRLRTRELASANRQLQRGIVRRKRVEAALQKSGQHYAKLLKDSLQLQEGLRHLTHQLLASQEQERKKISLELQTEIAQTLLGINVHLLSLKQEARVNSKGLKNEFASTRRLVAKSAQSVRRVAREFGKA